MNEYSHYVTGFFAHHEDAENAVSHLIERGLQRDQLTIFKSDIPLASAAPPTASDAVLKDVLVDGTIGTVVGTGIGALAEVALVVAHVSLFVASPLIAPLVMMGWGASLGSLIGAGVGAAHAGTDKHGHLSDLIDDALSHNQTVLVAETRTVQETARAEEVIRVLVDTPKDVRTTYVLPDWAKEA